MSAEASKEALAEASETEVLASWKVEGECSFQAAAESTEGLACWTERKPCLLDKMAGGGHRGQTRSGACRREPSAGRSQTKGAIKGFQTRKLARSDLGWKAAQAGLWRMDWGRQEWKQEEEAPWALS